MAELELLHHRLDDSLCVPRESALFRNGLVDGEGCRPAVRRVEHPVAECRGAPVVKHGVQGAVGGLTTSPMNNVQFK